MRFLLLVLLMALLTSCGEKHAPVDQTREATNKPYRVNGQWYYPLLKADGYDETGMASWYGRDFHGKKTSNGEVYDMHEISAAHPTLPMNTIVRVTNLENNQSIDLRINDRGPFVKERLIDLSYAAAKKIGFAKKGTTRVRVQAMGKGAKAVAPVTRYVAPQRSAKATVPEQVVTTTPIRTLPEVISSAHAGEAVNHATATAQQTPTAGVPVARTTAMTSTALERPYYVQIGAFVSRDSANKLQQKYVSTYPGLRIFVDDGQTPVVYKVRQGPFNGRERAEVLASRMEMQGVTNVSLVSDNIRPLINTPAPRTMPQPLQSKPMNRNFVADQADANSNTQAMKQQAMPTTNSAEQAGKIYVQIGAFSSMQRAASYRDRYIARYANTMVHPPHTGEPQVYRVRIGPFVDVTQVGSVVEDLEANGVAKAIVVVGR